MLQMIKGGGTVVAATASSVPGTLPAPAGPARAVYVYNDGPAPVCISVGEGAQTATLADFPLGSKECIVLAKSFGALGVAAIGTTAGPHNVYFAAVEGDV